MGVRSRELDPMVEHRTQFRTQREHITKVNMPNIAYPNQHIDTTWFKRSCNCTGYRSTYV